MARRFFFILLFLTAMVSVAQEHPEHGLKRIYAGLAMGSDFNRFHGGVQLSGTFHNSWGVSLDFMESSREAQNLPADYRGDVSVSVIGKGSPSDYMQSYSLLLTREIPLARNFGLLLKGGPRYTVQKTAHFEPVAERFLKSNYHQHHSTHDAFGITTRAGIYWIAARWCGFDLNFMANLNGLRSYAAINLCINLGWMGKDF